jgi:hypothetical protein
VPLLQAIEQGLAVLGKDLGFAEHEQGIAVMVGQDRQQLIGDGAAEIKGARAGQAGLQVLDQPGAGAVPSWR